MRTPRHRPEQLGEPSAARAARAAEPSRAPVMLAPELVELWLATPDPVLVFEQMEEVSGPDFRCVHHNPAAARALGGGRPLGGTMLSGWIPASRIPERLQALAELVAMGGGCPVELSPADRAPLRVLRGNAIAHRGALVIQLADARATADAERALHPSAAPFKAVEDLSPDGVMICRTRRSQDGAVADFEIEYLNPAAARVMGQPEESLVGHGVLEVRPALRGSPVVALYTRVVSGGPPEELEFHAWRSGRLEYWRLSCTPFEDGFAVRMIDVSERRRSEEVNRLLADANSVLGAFTELERMVSGVCTLLVPRVADLCALVLVDDDGRLQRVTARHADRQRQDALEQLALRFRPAGDVVVFPDDARGGEPQLVEDLPAAIAANARCAGLYRELRDHAGAQSWLAVPLRVQQRTVGMLGLGLTAGPRKFAPEDLPVTEELARRIAVAVDRAKLYELARTERIRAEEASRSKDDFLAVVSHELRTPLTAVLGWVRLLRTGAVTSDKRGKALETLERNARLQAQLIEDLLDVSRIISGKLRIDPKPMDLTRAVEAAIEVLRPAAEAKRVALEWALPEHAPLLGDPARLEQVVWNLLSNAIKFTAASGTVRVWITAREHSLEVGVRDSGVGISREFLPHVFERFRQADSSATRAHGGLGLGLSIVHHVVTLHGGSVRALSDGEGKGACFVVQLPLRPPERAARPVAAPLKAERLPLQSEDVLRGVRVLLVEDEPDSRELLQIMLQRVGAQVRAAESADEALQLLEGSPFDLMISDIGLPGTDGFSLMRAIRMLPAPTGRMPAIALTAYTRAEDRASALLSGFDLYVSKPVDSAELVTLAKTLTDTRARVGPR